MTKLKQLNFYGNECTNVLNYREAIFKFMPNLKMLDNLNLEGSANVFKDKKNIEAELGRNDELFASVINSQNMSSY